MLIPESHYVGLDFDSYCIKPAGVRGDWDIPSYLNGVQNPGYSTVI